MWTTAIGPLLPPPLSAPGHNVVHFTRTSGDFTVTANTLVNTELTGFLERNIAANAGDWIAVTLRGILTAAAAGVITLDSATLVSSAIFSQCSPGTQSIGHGYAQTGIVAVSGTLLYKVVAGDIVGGLVKFTVTFTNTSAASTGTLAANATNGLTYDLVNLGQ